MHLRSRAPLVLAQLTLATSSLVAQSLSVTPDIIQSGQPATVSIDDSSQANQTVNVRIRNAKGVEVTLSITLDASGKGSADWTPPAGWTQARFNYSTAPEVARYIQ